MCDSWGWGYLVAVAVVPTYVNVKQGCISMGRFDLHSKTWGRESQSQEM
jgi:hypothetical protein